MTDTASTNAGALLVRKARWLAYLTIAWNVTEAVVAITAGAAAGSLALVGFGIDSTIETLSAVVVLWRLSDVSEEREERALKLIAISFFLLAAYITVQSVRDLVTASQPDTSIVGIAITGLSLIVMPLLARAKQRVGRQMDSRVVIADAVETWLCTYLSASGSPGSFSTPRSAGGGPTPSPRSASPTSRSAKAAKPGTATTTAAEPQPTRPLTRAVRPASNPRPDQGTLRRVDGQTDLRRARPSRTAPPTVARSGWSTP